MCACSHNDVLLGFTFEYKDDWETVMGKFELFYMCIHIANVGTCFHAENKLGFWQTEYRSSPLSVLQHVEFS